MAEEVEKKRVNGLMHYCCVVCSEWYPAKERHYKPTCSTDCAMTRMLRNLEAMQSKRGDQYDKWLARTKAGMTLYLHGEGRGVSS